mmetsp:Transcript_53549/g.150457  ORF Transcript_53549/g.150457 Transcript_53549/m.150457 type:complete len:270 (-) Transcript_53549:570-1379(-)
MRVGDIEEQVRHAAVQIVEAGLQRLGGDLLMAAQPHKQLQGLLALRARALHGERHDLADKLRAALVGQRREVPDAAAELLLVTGVEVLEDHRVQLLLELQRAQVLLAVLRGAPLSRVEHSQACGPADPQLPAPAEEGDADELVGDEARDELDGELRGARAVELQVVELSQEARHAPLQVVLGQDTVRRQLAEQRQHLLARCLGIASREGGDDRLLDELVQVRLHPDLAEAALHLPGAQVEEILVDAMHGLSLELLQLRRDVREHRAALV